MTAVCGLVCREGRVLEHAYNHDIISCAIDVARRFNSALHGIQSHLRSVLSLKHAFSRRRGGCVDGTKENRTGAMHEDGRREGIYHVRIRQELRRLLPEGTRREIEKGLWVCVATDKRLNDQVARPTPKQEEWGGFGLMGQDLTLEDALHLFDRDQSPLGLRWDSTSQEVKALSPPDGFTTHQSDGLRLAVIVTYAYLESWSASEPTSTPDAVACCLVIELSEAYPLRPPQIAVVFFRPQEPLPWYDTPQARVSHLQLRDPQPLPALSVRATTDFCLGESWTPVITLESVMARSLAVIREQVISHHFCVMRSSDLPLTPPQVVGHAAPTPETFPPSRPRFSGLSLWHVIVLSTMLRIFLAYQPHSGQYNAPIYGDYEAQRHWKEIMINTPPASWYNVASQYWDLDYPPLTAYHEWILGRLSQWMFPASVTNTPASRGYLTPGHKLFMRATVLFSDLLVFHTAAIFFFLRLPDHLLVRLFLCSSKRFT